MSIYTFCSCGQSLEYVPEYMKTVELFVLAIKNICTRYATHSGVTSGSDECNKEMATELCKLVASTDGCVLECIPEQFRTADVCKTAVGKDGCALKYAPDQCLCYVQNN